MASLSKLFVAKTFQLFVKHFTQSRKTLIPTGEQAWPVTSTSEPTLKQVWLLCRAPTLTRSAWASDLQPLPCCAHQVLTPVAMHPLVGSARLPVQL